MKISANGVNIECARAVKGTDFIRLYDAHGKTVASFNGISDFIGYLIDGGSWEPSLFSGYNEVDERLAAVEAVVKGTPSYGELLEAVNILIGETP